jgi:hypothetical protein
MDLSTIRIDPDEAKARLDEYRQLVYENRTVEDEAITAGYRAAVRGLPVISLRRTFAAAGFHDDGLPRLAILNADATTCFAQWDGHDLLFSDHDRWGVNQGALVNKHSVRVQVAGDDMPQPVQGVSRRRRGQTIVPVVPPRFRPRTRSRLARRHILWEVDHWEPVPPEDPALLRHIRGDLWAVLATWNLTELERLVLSQRAS